MCNHARKATETAKPSAGETERPAAPPTNGRRASRCPGSSRGPDPGKRRGPAAPRGGSAGTCTSASGAGEVEMGRGRERGRETDPSEGARAGAQPTAVGDCPDHTGLLPANIPAANVALQADKERKVAAEPTLQPVLPRPHPSWVRMRTLRPRAQARTCGGAQASLGFPSRERRGRVCASSALLQYGLRFQRKRGLLHPLFKGPSWSRAPQTLELEWGDTEAEPGASRRAGSEECSKK